MADNIPAFLQQIYLRDAAILQNILQREMRSHSNIRGNAQGRKI